MIKNNNTLLYLGAALLLFAPVLGIGSIRKIKKISVYSAPGKTNIDFLNGKSGVYLIYYGDESAPRYIGYSGTNLYKTITRHFQSWNDRQIRVTYPQSSKYKVRAVVCSPHQAQRLERALIVKHQPVDNPSKYENYLFTPSDSSIIQSYEDAPF